MSAAGIIRDPVGYFGERLRAARGYDRPVASVSLGYRRIYILPTRAGYGFALVLLAMLAGAMNYSLSLGYVLTFLLAGLGLASMLHTFQNLNRLRFSAGRADPVFAGETALFHIIADSSQGSHHGVWLRPGNRNSHSRDFDPVRIDLEPNDSVAVKLRIAARHRGRLSPGRLTVDTEYPLGLFHSWSWINLDIPCLVYPRPWSRALPLPPARGASGAASGAIAGRGTDDFQGLRDYVLGDSMRHVHWKALARGQGMLTKEFAGLSDSALWIRLEDAPVPDIESKLSVLTRWVVDANAADQIYGLELGARRIPPNRGEAHMHACLSALALYGATQ